MNIIIIVRCMGENYCPFKVRYDIDERKERFKQVQKQMQEANNKNMVLIIMEPHPRAKGLMTQNWRFSCQRDRTVSYLLGRIRKKKLHIDSQINFFLYVDNNLLMGNRNMGQVYDTYHDADGFLYLNYAQMEVY